LVTTAISKGCASGSNVLKSELSSQRFLGNLPPRPQYDGSSDPKVKSPGAVKPLNFTAQVGWGGSPLRIEIFQAPGDKNHLLYTLGPSLATFNFFWLPSGNSTVCYGK